MTELIFKHEWWGYVHINGSLQVKRYFDRRDIQEARESDMVKSVYGPFWASGRVSALMKLQQLIAGRPIDSVADKDFSYDLVTKGE